MCAALFTFSGQGFSPHIDISLIIILTIANTKSGISSYQFTATT